jgi:hypothetical protein
MYYMGMSYWECYNIPVSYRIWFIQRINEEIKKSGKDGETQSRAAHHNTPDIRAMQGRARAQVPSNLRRFT